VAFKETSLRDFLNKSKQGRVQENKEGEGKERGETSIRLASTKNEQREGGKRGGRGRYKGGARKGTKKDRKGKGEGGGRSYSPKVSSRAVWRSQRWPPTSPISPLV
jgi:hypothetical protein